MHILVKFVSVAMLALAPTPSGVGWQHDNTVEVAFVQNPNAAENCGVAPEGYVNMACVNDIGGKKMILPNPCMYKDVDAYARVACHELAHTNYWRHEYR